MNHSREESRSAEALPLCGSGPTAIHPHTIRRSGRFSITLRAAASSAFIPALAFACNGTPALAPLDDGTAPGMEAGVDASRSSDASARDDVDVDASTAGARDGAADIDGSAPTDATVPTDASQPLDATADASSLPDAVAIGCVAPSNGAPVDDPYRRVRTTAELPDDQPDSYQIHALYVEPSDRDSNPRLDEDGSIRRSITAWSAWLAARTGGPKLRVDTCGGVIDVTYVKLASQFTEVAMAQGTTLAPNGTVYLRDRLEATLKTTFADPKKIYLVYYDGLSFGHCGGAPRPPGLIGHFPGLFIGGLFHASFLTQIANAGDTHLTVYDPAAAGLSSGSYTAKLGSENVSVTGITGTDVTLASPLSAAHAVGEMILGDVRPPDCRSNPFSANGISLGYTDYSGPHEVLHTLGIVASAAKFYSTTAPGHLTEASAGGTSDLMYQGAMPWTCSGPIHANPQVSPCVLDPAHENYMALPSGSAAIDLAQSVFLEPTPPNAQVPPGW